APRPTSSAPSSAPRPAWSTPPPSPAWSPAAAAAPSAAASSGTSGTSGTWRPAVPPGRRCERRPRPPQRAARQAPPARGPAAHDPPPGPHPAHHRAADRHPRRIPGGLRRPEPRQRQGQGGQVRGHRPDRGLAVEGAAPHLPGAHPAPGVVGGLLRDQQLEDQPPLRRVRDHRRGAEHLPDQPRRHRGRPWRGQDPDQRAGPRDHRLAVRRPRRLVGPHPRAEGPGALARHRGQPVQAGPAQGVRRRRDGALIRGRTVERSLGPHLRPVAGAPVRRRPGGRAALCGPGGPNDSSGLCGRRRSGRAGPWPGTPRPGPVAARPRCRTPPVESRTGEPVRGPRADRAHVEERGTRGWEVTGAMSGDSARAGSRARAGTGATDAPGGEAPVPVRLAAVFRPAPVPREGRVAFWDPHLTHGAAGPEAAGPEGADATALTVVRPHGSGVRRRTAPARTLPLDEALPLLVAARHDPAAHPATACWGAAALHALRLTARGRLLPGLTAEGHDAWRAGPLDPDDVAHLRAVAAALPPEGHAVPLPGPGPIRLPGPEALVRAFLDAVADLLPRSPA